MNNDESKHLYPIEKDKKETLIKHSAKSKQLNMINIGQILLICFLFVIIFMQTTGIIFNLADSVSNLDYQPDKDSYGENQNANANLPQSDNKSKNITENNFNQRENSNISNTENITRIESKIVETIFILGENNGKLAVLSPDGQTVYEIFDVYINTLPDYDIILLQNGIKIKTPEELYSLLEDYNS